MQKKGDLRGTTEPARRPLDGSGKSQKKHTAIIRGLLVALMFLTFGRVVTHEFLLWDDRQLIYKNPNLDPPTVTGLLNHWRGPHLYLYIPVVYSVWWGLARVAQLEVADARGSLLNPYVFHAANLMVHAINALIVFEILRRLIKRPWAASAGAMIFALHPLQVEPVAWATGMKDLLCAMFSLLAIWGYLKWRIEERRSQFAYGGATLCFALAMLCKPSAVMLPVAVAALDRWVVGTEWRKVAGSLWVWAMLAVPMIVITGRVQPAADVADVPVAQRFLVAGDALTFYLKKLFWPATLAMDYGRTPQVVLNNPEARWEIVVPVLAIAALVASRQKVLWASGVIFLAPVVPVLGLTKFAYQLYSTVSDRYLYMSMLGVGLAVSWGMTRIPARGLRFAWGGVAVVIAMLATRSFAQVGVWAGDRTFLEHQLAVNPRSWEAELNLGAAVEMDGDVAAKNGDGEKASRWFAEAEEHYQRALELRPGYGDALLNLADVRTKQGKYAQAVAPLETVLKAQDRLGVESEENTDGHLQLGRLYLGLGKVANAQRELKLVLVRRPADREARKWLGEAEKRGKEK